MYNIESIIGRKRIFREVSGSIQNTGSPKKDARIKEFLDDAGRLAFEQEEDEQSMMTKMNKLKNRQDWENVINLNAIIYQSVLSGNPSQLCTITFDEIKDTFIYRLYRN